MISPDKAPLVVNWATRTRFVGPAIPLVALGRTNQPPPVRSSMKKLDPFPLSAGSKSDTHELDPDSRMEIPDSPFEDDGASSIPIVTKLSNSLDGKFGHSKGEMPAAVTLPTG